MGKAVGNSKSKSKLVKDLRKFRHKRNNKTLKPPPKLTTKYTKTIQDFAKGLKDALCISPAEDQQETTTQSVNKIQGVPRISKNSLRKKTKQKIEQHDLDKTLRIASNPAFQSDPMALMLEHLSNTIKH
jgi:hypothetical protein